MGKGKNIKKAIDKISAIKNELAEIETLLRKATNEEIVIEFPDWKRSRMQVLEAIENESGIITKEKLHIVAKKAGFDTRGLGGFFTRDKSLVQIAGKKVAITDSGKKRLKEFKEELEALES